MRFVSVQNGKGRNIDDPVLWTKVDKERWCKDWIGCLISAIGDQGEEC